MDMKELHRACLELMETAPAVYLTTIGDDGYPHTRAMLNLRNREQYPRHTHLYTAHQDDLMVYLSTNTSSGKIAQIQASPKACLYYCHPLDFCGMALVGDIEIVDDLGIKRALWNEGWEKYYPGGVEDPDNMVLRLYPTRASGWRNFSRFEFAIHP
jgi:general stress protein 26